MFVLYKWLKHYEEKNEKIKREWAFNMTDKYLPAELEKRNACEVKRKYHIKYKGTYGEIETKIVLVLLSNGEVLRYDLKYHRNDGNFYYEFIREAKTCEEKELRQIIDGFTFRKLLGKLKPDILVIFCFVLPLVLIAITWWLSLTFGLVLLYCLVGYLFFAFAARTTLEHFNVKIARMTESVLFFPLGIIGFALSMMMPLLTVGFSFLMAAMFAFGIPALVLKAISLLFVLRLTDATVCFITLSFGTVFCVFWSGTLQYLLKNFSPLRNWGNHSFEEKGEELALYSTSGKNIHYLVLLAYAVYLGVSGYLSFQYDECLFDKDIDAAVLKAFLFFLVFANLKKFKNEVNFDWTTFKLKILQRMFAKDKLINKEDNENN